jgi:NAD(P)-dependent dehydrogenase (short-subunit alcohol dehydrogenase family)
MSNQVQDPREAGKKGQEEAELQPIPGSDEELRPQADHGEQSYRGHGRLQGMASIITGADSGIGRAVAIAFAREGADVLISYLEEDEDARETERWVSDAGRKAVVLRGDIQSEQHCKQIVETAMREFGRIDILVNNAAFQITHEKLEDWPVVDFERAFRVNVFGMFYLCKAAIPHMKPGASIINTASIQAYDPNPVLLAYSATKAAIVNFTKAAGQQVKQNGIRVNAVAPGPVWTPLIPSTFDKEKVRKFGTDTVFGRAAQPSEMAPAFVFLASKDASYMSGEVISLTGGRSPV